jgi:hypothetical protein
VLAINQKLAETAYAILMGLFIAVIFAWDKEYYDMEDLLTALELSPSGSTRNSVLSYQASAHSV